MPNVRKWPEEIRKAKGLPSRFPAFNVHGNAKTGPRLLSCCIYFALVVLRVPDFALIECNESMGVFSLYFLLLDSDCVSPVG